MTVLTFWQTFLCAVFLCALTGSQAQLSPEDEQLIDDYVLEILECTSIPGMNLAVVQNGEVLLSKGYGKADLEQDTDVTSSTLFNIASTTKAFTAVLLSQLLDEHPSYSRETPVREMIGHWFHFSSGYRSNVTTLRDLLAHKTGLARHDYLWVMDQWSNQELLERIRFFEPIYPFRSVYSYNNNMYGVAGHVAESLADDQPFEDLVTDRIFRPLGMDDSTWIHTSGPDYEGFAIPYYGPRDGERYPTPWDVFNGDRSIPGAGAIASNSDDMAKWLNFLLGHSGITDPPLNVDVARETFEGEIPTNNEGYWKPEYDETMHFRSMYARGWLDGHYRGYRVISHGGDMDGYHSQVSLLPDVDVGIYHSYNYPDHGFERMCTHAFIADVVLGLRPPYNASDICSWSFGDALVQEDPIPGFLEKGPLVKADFVEFQAERPLSDYAGLYGNFAYGNVTITYDVTEDVLQLRYGNNGFYDLLPTEDDDVFQGVGNGSPSDVITLGLVIFGSSGGDDTIDTLTIPRFEFRDPPSFFRDLSLADAPPPDLEDCGTDVFRP